MGNLVHFAVDSTGMPTPILMADFFLHLFWKITSVDSVIGFFYESDVLPVARQKV